MNYTILESERLYDELDETRRRVSDHRESLVRTDISSAFENFHSQQLRLGVGNQIELSDRARAAQIMEFGSKRIKPDFFDVFLEIFEGCGRDFSKAREIFESLVERFKVENSEMFEAR